MPTLFAIAPRMLALGSRRETTLVLAGVIVVGAVMAHWQSARVVETANPAEKGWTGELASAAPVDMPRAEAMSSASLVVPKDQLALPAPPPKPTLHVKAVCDSADKTCVVRPAPIAVPPRRQVATLDRPGLLLPPERLPPSISQPVKQKPTTPEPTKGFSLNPLNHMPDMSFVGRPFAAAGHAVGGWMKWF